jgi:2-methylcitrate dehydratase PrpD
MSLTKTLGQFIADLSPNRLPEDALRVARLGFIDCIGTMIAGRREDCVRIMREVLAPADGPATLTFGKEKSTAPEAAWINGTAAHALDYDDVGLRGHPSTVLVPAILAEGETLGSTGADMVVAYVAGYETWAELFRRDTGLLHQKGWHPTGLYGAVGAAAACASLRRLDADKTAQAIALGASQSSGLMANFGTMTKPFHAGKAAHAGIREMGHPQPGDRDQEISHLLLHASRDRLHARSGERDADQGGRGEENHRQHQRLLRNRAA